MNGAHLHLLVNHLPVIGVVFGLLLFTGGYLFRQSSFRRAGLVLFTLSGLFAIPAFLSGEGAEETVEGVAGIQESYINTHEDWATVYVWLAGVLGVFSLAAFWLDIRQKKSAPYAFLAVFLLSVITLGISTKVSNSGGEVRHTEIRSGAVTVGSQTETGGEQSGDDD